MVSKALKIRLGIFIAIGSLLIIVFAAVVAGSRLVEKRDIYYIQFENFSVTGLQVGGIVNYQGIRVGRVDDIRISPKDVTKIIVKISVDRGTPIKEDTEAVLMLTGITGIKAVEIRGGTNATRLVKPGSYIKAGTTMLDDISVKALSIIEKVDMIAANISELTDKENRENLAKILSETSLLIANTRENLTTTMISISRVSDNVADLTEGLNDNIDDITKSLTAEMSNITSTGTRSVDELTKTTNESIVRLTDTLNQQLLTLTNNLDTHLNEISEQSKLLISDTRFQINNVGSHTDQMVLESTKQITTLSTNLNKSIDQVNTLLYSPEFSALIANLNALSGQLNQANVSGMVSELSTTLQKASNLMSTLNRVVVRGQGNLLDTLDSLAEASENLNEFSRQISDTPSILLRGN
ncbi:MAG: MCE family protein [Candidatus Cloacimonetes bacterium]|nr:MCE family protein [Candidatus Cloacimonadota bacterium]